MSTSVAVPQRFEQIDCTLQPIDIDLPVRDETNYQSRCRGWNPGNRSVLQTKMHYTRRNAPIART